MAPVNGVVVGEATWRATQAVFEYERLAPVQVKGKAEPVPIWRAQAARSRPGGQDESFVAWRRFLHLVAGQGPLVLVIEDLHWADPALLDFLEPLLDQPGPADLLVVVTARPALLERRPGWGAGHPKATTVALAPPGHHRRRRAGSRRPHGRVRPGRGGAAGRR